MASKRSLPFRLPSAGRRLLALWACGLVGLAAAQTSSFSVGPKVGERPPERGVAEWLMRMHDASRQRSYAGTFIVSSSAGGLFSARIWHACCEADRQVERVETLTGVPRATMRRNDEVMTFLPEQKLVRLERRETLGLFPDLLKSSETAIPDFYAARQIGVDRVAGFEADVVQLAPKDSLRFGYRIWSERKSGLVVKLQTLGTEGEVLEQAAFSELQIDAGIKPDKLLMLMAAPEGWRVERADTAKTTPAAEGWGLKNAISGFKPMSCWRRRTAGAPEGAMQWIFSDGLASVSVFVEPYDAQRHAQEGMMVAGATLSLSRRLQDWWLTVVGEVPPQTLRAFALNLERRK